jgi:hypothetical protein
MSQTLFVFVFGPFQVLITKFLKIVNTKKKHPVKFNLAFISTNNIKSIYSFIHLKINLINLKKRSKRIKKISILNEHLFELFIYYYYNRYIKYKNKYKERDKFPNLIK